MTERPTRPHSELMKKVRQLMLHDLMGFNRLHHPDGRVRTREARAALPPLIDALRTQFGGFRRHATVDEAKVALAAERALALEDSRLTAADKEAWVIAVDHLAAEWAEEDRTALENSGDQTPGTAATDDRRRRRLVKKQVGRRPRRAHLDDEAS